MFKVRAVLVKDLFDYLSVREVLALGQEHLCPFYFY